MQTKKIVSIIAAIAAVSSMALSVSAADWSQASYADNDPNTVKIVAQTETGIEFTNTTAQTDICKARITLDKVLVNPADYAKIAKMSWKVTYNNVTPDFKGDALSGGSYITNANSVGYKIEPDSYDENDVAVWNKSTYEIVDTFEAASPVVENGELVFMDWSYSDIAASGITVTISDFKIFDADGNEIAQLGLNEWTESSAETTEPAVSENPAEPEPEAKDEGKEVESVPNVPTGNVGTSVAAAICGIAGAGIIATRKRK